MYAAYYFCFNLPHLKFGTLKMPAHEITKDKISELRVKVNLRVKDFS